MQAIYQVVFLIRTLEMLAGVATYVPTALRLRKIR